MEGCIMYVDYSKLWKLLIDCRMNKTQLKKVSGISYNFLDKLSRNEFVSIESLFRICLALKCDIGDIVSFKIEKLI